MVTIHLSRCWGFFDQVLFKINNELNKSDIIKEIRNKLSKIKDNISNES